MNKFRLTLIIGTMISFISMILIVSSFALAQVGTGQGATGAGGNLDQYGKPLERVPLSQSVLPNATYFASQALVFVPLSSSMTYHGGQAGCRVSDGIGDFFAPVDIPDGSIVDALEVVYYNQSSTSQSSVVSLALGTDSGGWQTLSVLVFINKTPGFHLQSIAMNHEINTFNNSYSFYWVAGGSDIELCQARLYYRPPIWTVSALPIIKK